MTFPECEADKRTNESFLRQDDKEFHTGETLLTTVPGLDFIRCFPLDYMHLVCLGVVRSLVYLWSFGPVPKKLPSQVLNKISGELIAFKINIPMEFNRKPRSLNDIKRWKATEFRQFLLYSGPVALKVVFSQEYQSLYNHFLSLSIAISILLNPKFLMNSDYIAYAKTLLVHFVETTKDLYGHKYLTHNMHGLTHIADSVEDFGSLDCSSAFPFENFLQFFKRKIRKGDKPLQQIVKRLCEISFSNSSLFSTSTKISEFPHFSKPHFEGPILSDASEQYSCVQFANYAITNKPPNCYCHLRCGSIVAVENIVFSKASQEFVIICREFLEKENFFPSDFIDSTSLDIYLISNLSVLKEKSVSGICSKMILLPYGEKQVAFPLLHS